MRFAEALPDGRTTFEGVVPCVRSGKFGFAIRVLPRHTHLPNPFQTGLIRVFDRIDS
jgi:hypothetical protein